MESVSAKNIFFSHARLSDPPDRKHSPALASIFLSQLPSLFLHSAASLPLLPSALRGRLTEVSTAGRPVRQPARMPLAARLKLRSVQADCRRRRHPHGRTAAMATILWADSSESSSARMKRRSWVLQGEVGGSSAREQARRQARSGGGRQELCCSKHGAAEG